jgi:hypothetical protein
VAKPDLKAYQTKMSELGIQMLETEQIVLNPALGVAGTFDRTVTVPGFDLPVILDIKTGGTVDFSHLEHSVQLGIYANAPFRFNTETGKVDDRELGERQRADRASPRRRRQVHVHEIDIAKGWQLAQIAKAVYDARRDKTLSRPFEART